MSRRPFASVMAGEPLPSLTKTVTRGDIAAYAQASLDRNPLHLHDEHAYARGFDGVIAHGMLAMAHLVTCISAWAGDPTALAHMRASFRAAVRPGEDIIAGGEVACLDPDTKTASLEVWVAVERDGTTEYAIKRGRAEVRLA